MNLLSLIGTLLSVAALALAIAQGVLHKFVEVFIPTNVSNPDDPVLSCSIAGLGIFTTIYDSSCLTPEVLASSRVPSEKFTSPTTEFKLLFPAQENFVAEVLPINRDLLCTFDTLTGAAPCQGSATALLGPKVDNITNTAFESCTQYMDDIEFRMLDLFTLLNGGLMPLFVPLIVNDSVFELKTAVSQIDASLGAPAVAQANALQAVNVATFIGVLVNTNMALDCNVTADMDITFDSGQATCIQGFYQDSANFFGSTTAAGLLLAGLGSLFPTCAVIPGLNTPNACLGVGVITQITTSQIFLPASFAAGFPGQQNVCGLIGFCDATSNKPSIAGAYAQAAGPLLASVDATLLPLPIQLIFAQVAQAVQGLGAYALTMQFLAAPVFTVAGTIGSTIASDVDVLLDSILDPAPFPTSQTTFYTPCTILQIGAQAFAADGFVSAFLTNVPGQCGFNAFFPGAAEIAAFTNDPLAELVGSLGELYGLCASPAFGLTPQECQLLFPSIFISGAYSFDLNVSAFSKTTPSAVFEEGIAACEDDETDLEKVKIAQALFIVCLSSYSLALIAGVVSLLLPKFQALVSVLAGLLVILALGTNAGALLSVRSAPVYDSVSEPPEVDSPFYKEGIVVLLALLTMIVSALTAFVYFGASFAAVKGKCGAKTETETGIETKEALVATIVKKEDPVAKPSV